MSDTSTKALTSAVAAGGFYMLGQTAFRFGARRVGAILFGGTAVGLAAASLFLLYDAISTAPATSSSDSQDLRGVCEMQEREPEPPCLICKRSASDVSCSSRRSEASETSGHAFCNGCFNIYANQGLMEGGFFEQDETSPTGKISLPGQMPCPMFGRGCSCAALPMHTIRNHLTSENINLLDAAAERIAKDVYGATTAYGVRQRNLVLS